MKYIYDIEILMDNMQIFRNNLHRGGCTMGSFILKDVIHSLSLALKNGLNVLLTGARNGLLILMLPKQN